MVVKIHSKIYSSSIVDYYFRDLLLVPYIIEKHDSDICCSLKSKIKAFLRYNHMEKLFITLLLLNATNAFVIYTQETWVCRDREEVGCLR